jgi:hypothetical protein
VQGVAATSTIAAFMRRLAVIATLLACSLLVTAVAQGGKPRLEQKRLRPSDMALAKRTTLRASDVGPGWTRGTPDKQTNELPPCPGVDMDFSRFTITGTAQSRYVRSGAAIDSYVEVFKSRADAAADFRKASTAPVLRCLGRWLRSELKRELPTVRFLETRLVSRPQVGEQAILYRIVMEVPTGSGDVRLYVDLLAFQRGRTTAALGFSSPRAPLRQQLQVGRAVAARAR